VLFIRFNLAASSVFHPWRPFFLFAAPAFFCIPSVSVTNCGGFCGILKISDLIPFERDNRVMVGISLVLASAFCLGQAGHLQTNPVFQDLVTQGVSPGGNVLFPLPAPSMADGLDAAAQKKIITEIAKPSYTFDQFVKNSPVAPQVLKIEEHKAGPETPMWGVDLYFVGYGNMNALVNQNFLQNAFQANNNNNQGAQGMKLTPEQLADRKIAIAPNNKEYEGYSQSIVQLLTNVQLSIVTHSFWSRNDDSIVTAAVLDPRFMNDPEFPNTWQPIRNVAGRQQLGAPQPYQGLGMYMKITRLAAPAGALFVEAHAVYHEPQGWFNGQNVLRSKIRTATGQKVKEMRQEFLRAGQPQPAQP
jgi:hypothetical protein